MREEELLKVKDLSFTYEEEPVLKNISLTVRHGEKIAVMGSNGAGKSTFFLNLNGVLKPDAGEIFLNGRKIGKKDMGLLRRQVVFVFQDADSQIIASNVRAEISFGPMNLGLDRAEVIRRVDSAVSYLQLEELQKRAPHYLSGGEKKRVSIADILAMEPELLIFDEPMAALDPVNAQKVEEVFRCTKWAGYLPPEDGQPKEDEKPVLFIAVIENTDMNPNCDTDAGLAIGNMTLAAWNRGVGSCIIGACDKTKLSEMFGLTKEQKLHTVVAFGYPSHKSSISDAENPDEIKYFLDENRDYVVPKRKTEDVVTYL